MSTSTLLRRYAIVSAAISLSVAQVSAASIQAPLSEPEARQFLSLVQEGKLPEAIALEKEASKKRTKDWLPHAALAYCAWRQGDILTAIPEGKTAVRLAPSNLMALTNLAKMEESLDNCIAAIPLYKRIEKLAPTDWQPKLGLARCYLKLEKEQDALTLLSKMAAQKNTCFDWHFELADTYLRSASPALAAEAATTALSLATTPEQNSRAKIQLMMALLRAKQSDRARELMTDVFKDGQPRDYELFVRAAAALVPATSPAAATILMNSARQNLLQSEDADGFYRLGRIFEDKATFVAYDKDKFAAWMRHAEAAYSGALTLDSMQARYHLALAGTLQELGKSDDARAELAKAQALDSFDSLAPFLLAQLTAPKVEASSTAADSRANRQSKQMNLTTVRFTMTGLDCTCHIAKVEAALTKVNGVAFAGVSRALPHNGVLLVDKSATPLAEVFSACLKSFEAGPTLKTPVSFAFAVTSQHPLTRAQDAVRIAQNTRYGEIVQFYNQFKAVEPVVPVTLQDERAISLK